MMQDTRLCERFAIAVFLQRFPDFLRQRLVDRLLSPSGSKVGCIHKNIVVSRSTIVLQTICGNLPTASHHIGIFGQSQLLL